VVAKPLKRTWDGQIKANCDMEMALEILRTAHSLDVVIIVTGDSDFVSLVNELSLMGKRLILVCSEKGVSLDLMRVCDETVRIEEIPCAVELKRVVEEALEAEAVSP
jgi:uncharacterized protein (TIGR00288 family)